MNVGKLCIAILSLLALAGCNQLAEKPSSLLVGIDTSGSARPHLAPYAFAATKLAMSQDYDRDRLYLYRVDSQCQEVYGPKPPMGEEEMQALLGKHLKPESLRKGTLPALFFEAAALRAEQEQADVVVVYLTDGGNDDMTRAGAQRMKSAALALAENPRVLAVVLAGTLPGTREKLREQLGALGEKLRFTEVAEVVSEVR